MSEREMVRSIVRDVASSVAGSLAGGGGAADPGDQRLLEDGTSFRLTEAGDFLLLESN